MSETKPDFIIIGAMKCGTTSLHYYLRNHPDIYMPREKELDFFGGANNYEKGVSWYTSKFKSQYLLNGEASPNYTKVHLFEGVPEKMYRLLPNVKLIYLYRDPIDRAYSHYLHSLSTRREKKNLENALTENSNYILTSRYYWQLEQFLKYYPLDQFLILNSDQLRKNRKNALKKIYDFLGVDYFYDEDIIEKNRQSSSLKTRRSKFNYLFLNTNTGDYLKKIVPEEFKQFYKKLTEKKLDQPELSDTLKKELQGLVKEDQRKFKGLLMKQKSGHF